MQLFEAWIKLQSDFYELIEDRSVANSNKISSKIGKIELKIVVVSCLVDALRENYTEELAEELRLWGYKISEKTAEKDLQRVASLLGNDKTKLALAMNDYEKSKVKSGEVTKAHFMKVLLSISKHRGQHYRPEQINTYEFALMYKEIQDYSQQLKIAQNGIQRKDR